MTTFSSALRRFSVVTGASPDTRISGIVFPDGMAVYRKFLVSDSQTGDGVYTTEFTGGVADIAFEYGGRTGYALTYSDPTSVDLVSIDPVTGPAAGATSCTLAGSGFQGVTSVRFGTVEVPIANIAVNAEGTFITCPSPAHAAGVVDITVTTPNGSDTLVGGYTYT